MVKERESWHAAVWGHKESDTIEQLNNKSNIYLAEQNEVAPSTPQQGRRKCKDLLLLESSGLQGSSCAFITAVVKAVSFIILTQPGILQCFWLSLKKPEITAGTVTGKLLGRKSFWLPLSLGLAGNLATTFLKADIIDFLPRVLLTSPHLLI